MRTKPSPVRPCTHFNGIQHAACRVGVNYRALADTSEFGYALRMKGKATPPLPSTTP